MSALIGVVVLIPLLVLGQTSLAQGPAIVQHSDTQWQATYWNNTSLSGSPVLERMEPDLDFDWGTGSPDLAVNADYFSARWTRTIDVTAGTYHVSVTCDDGMRVWVDGDLLIDQWHDHPPTTYTAETYLGTGHHFVHAEYYENSGLAVARFSLAQGSAPLGWRGEYYNNRTLTGSPSLVRDDPWIGFAWGSGSPAPGQINADLFSIRWTRSLDMDAGTHRFTVTVDDGVRLYVNGHLLIDAWRDQAASTYTGDIYLPGGQVMVQMEYYETKGDATARLEVSPAPLSRTCEVEWFFPGEPQIGVCPTGAIHSFAAAQHFERGTMIWLKQLGRYVILDEAILYDQDVRRQVFYVHDPLEITRDTSAEIVPPAGLHAPESGFGLVWRGDASQSPGYSQALGWALAPEFGYEAIFQCDDARPSGGRSWQTCYLKGPEGEVIVFHPLGGWHLLGER
jgi:hypothetical protein